MHLRSYKRAACLIQLDLVGGSHAKPNQVAFAILIIDGGFLLAIAEWHLCTLVTRGT